MYLGLVFVGLSDFPAAKSSVALHLDMQDKMIGVIIHWYMQCSMYPEFPPLVEDVHACIN